MKPKPPEVAIFLAFCLLVGGAFAVVMSSTNELLRLPAGITPIAAGPGGTLYVSLDLDLIGLDADGEVFSRRRLAREPGDTEDPVVSDLAFDGEGDLFLSDFANRKIKKYSSEGRLIWQAGRAGHGAGEIWGTTKVCPLPDGRIAVTDAANHRLLFFDREGRHQRSVGQKGKGAGAFQFPNGIVRDARGRLLVADTNNERIAVLDAAGAFTKGIPLKPAAGCSTLPVYLGSDGSGDLYVLTGAWRNLDAKRVWKLDPEGRLLGEIGVGELSGDVGNLVVRQDSLLLADNRRMRIAVFDLSGAPRGEFGGRGIREEFSSYVARRGRLESRRRWSRGLLFLLLAAVLPFYVVQAWRERKAGAARFARSGIALPDLALPEANRLQRLGLPALIVALPTLPLLVLAALAASRGALSPGALRAGLLVVCLLTLVLMVLALLFLRRAMSGGAWLAGVLRTRRRAARNFLPRIVTLFSPGERILWYGLVTSFEREREVSGRGGIPGTFLFVTDRRLLLVEADALRTRVQRAGQIAPGALAALLTRPLAAGGALSRPALPGQVLEIRLKDDTSVKLFAPPYEIAQLAGILESLKGEATGPPADGHGLRKLCPRCFRPREPRSTYCLNCGWGAKAIPPARAALLSGVYPGLGQLANGSLGKGIFLMVFATAALIPTITAAWTWHARSAEIGLGAVLQGALLTIGVWVLAVLDAHREARRRGRG